MMESTIDFEAALTSHVAKADRKHFLKALDELCLRCDRSFIVVRLAMRKEPGFLTSGSWDSLARWELRDRTLQNDKQVTSGYYAGTKDFERIRKRTAAIITEVRKLRSTRWVHQLVDASKIRQGDLLHTSTGLDCFDGLLSLERWSREKRRDKTDENELLAEIVSHVHERTRQWRDRALGEVHHFLRLPHQTEDDMKSWRASRRNKQTDKKRKKRG